MKNHFLKKKGNILNIYVYFREIDLTSHLTSFLAWTFFCLPVFILLQQAILIFTLFIPVWDLFASMLNIRGIWLRESYLQVFALVPSWWELVHFRQGFEVFLYLLSDQSLFLQRKNQVQCVASRNVVKINNKWGISKLME